MASNLKAASRERGEKISRETQHTPHRDGTISVHPQSNKTRMFLPRTTRELSVRRPRNINRGSSRRGTRETAAREQADKHRAHQGSSAFVFLPCPPWGWRSNESPIRHRPGAPAAPSSGMAAAAGVCACAWAKQGERRL
jgi:hypothetical protein